MTDDLNFWLAQISHPYLLITTHLGWSQRFGWLWSNHHLPSCQVKVHAGLTDSFGRSLVSSLAIFLQLTTIQVISTWIVTLSSSLSENCGYYEYCRQWYGCLKTVSGNFWTGGTSLWLSAELHAINSQIWAGRWADSTPSAPLFTLPLPLPRYEIASAGIVDPKNWTTEMGYNR